MSKKESTKTALKKEPDKTKLKKSPAKTVLKKESAKTALKKEPDKAKLKRSPAKTVLKKEAAKTALKKEPDKAKLKKTPAKAVLKKETAKTISKHSEIKISHFENQFMVLLDELTEINKKYGEKAIKDTASYDPSYVDVKKAGDRLFTALKNGSLFFFKKPTYDTLHHFKRICKREIALAEHEYKKHRGLWHQINPIVNGIQNIIAGLSAVPALIDATTSKMGKLKPSYRGQKSALKNK